MLAMEHLRQWSLESNNVKILKCQPNCKLRELELFKLMFVIGRSTAAQLNSPHCSILHTSQDSNASLPVVLIS